MSEPKQHTKKPCEDVDSNEVEQQFRRPGRWRTAWIPLIAQVEEFLRIVTNHTIDAAITDAPIHVLGVVDGPGVYLAVMCMRVTDEPSS